jgi:hypothetical protein
MDRTVKVLVIIFAVVGIALFGYHWVDQWHTNVMNRALEGEKEDCLKKIAEMEAQIHQLTEEMEAQRQSTPTKTELDNVFGITKPGTPSQPEIVDCTKTTAQVAAFFQYLDSKAYLIWPGINMKAEELFDEITRKMAANPPINVGEMEKLYSLVRNVTHFYRILGKDRIDLIKVILSSESGVVEPAMAVMSTWLMDCGNATVKTKTQLNANTLYQYACFFLNTLGGRSYLLRRDSKVRMLVNYYALLILDKANDTKSNSYGLDIRPYLDYAFYDLSNQKGLMYRNRYLTRLSALKDKYQ